MTGLSSFHEFASLVSSFTCFLNVAVHTVLYERGIYPATSFLSARKYNCPVRQNRHPAVCKWVNDAIAAVESEMLKDTVSRVAVVIYSPTSQPLERFMFDVARFPPAPPPDPETDPEASLLPDSEDDEPSEAVTPLHNADLEEQFRGMLQRLALCSSSLGTLPSGCSFTICIELKDRVEPPIGHPQPWIPSRPSLQPPNETSSSHAGADVGGVRTTAVRSIEVDHLLLELWIEESRSKVSVQSNGSNESP